MHKKNDKARVRKKRGEYYVTPADAPERTPGGEPYWEVNGMTLSGARIRARHPSHEAAINQRQTLENDDTRFRAAKEQLKPAAVIVSRELNKDRLEQASRAVALLPIDPVTGLASERYRIDDGIAFALKAGWDPRNGNQTVKELSDLLCVVLNERAALPWSNSNHLSKSTLKKSIRQQNACVQLFGKETIDIINSKEYQETLLKESALSDKRRRNASQGLGRLLRYFSEKGSLKDKARVFRYNLKSDRIPCLLSIMQQQEYLDEFWATEFAAAAVARLLCGVRPWSDCDEETASKVVWGLTTDYKTFHVPNDAKTGWRPVRVPPVAQMLFRRLDQEGRLSRGKNEHGNHVIYVGSPNNWSYHQARLGYKCSSNMIVHWLHTSARLTPEQAYVKFRAKYPERYGYFGQDRPRSTNITAYLWATNGAKSSCADYHGNSEPIIDTHYRGMMTLAEAMLHYRLIPTILKGEIDPETIPLPSWSAVEMDAQELEEYNKLAASLPKFAEKRAAAEMAKLAGKIPTGKEAVRIARLAQPIVGDRGHKDMGQYAHLGVAKRQAKKLADRAPRAAALVEYCKEFPDGFRYGEIEGILKVAGVKNAKTSDWFRRWFRSGQSPFMTRVSIGSHGPIAASQVTHYVLKPDSLAAAA